jgi:hypothetical protein
MSKRGAVAVDRDKALKYLRMIKVDFQRSSEPRSTAYPLRNTGVLKVISLAKRFDVSPSRISRAAEVGETTFIEKLRQSIQRPAHHRSCYSVRLQKLKEQAFWPRLFDDQPNRSDKR